MTASWISANLVPAFHAALAHENGEILRGL
jgi:hypothetical protein